MTPAQPAPATIPDGQRVYAIGDIHGCLDRLVAMHAAIAEDLAARPVPQATVVHLGDYVDRGPDSAGVIAHLLKPFAAIGDTPPPRVLHLMGNHEAMMLDALSGGTPTASRVWLHNGGGEALVSWGLVWRDGPDAWVEKLPPTHHGFLRGLALIYRIGGYAFVHAGLRPERAMMAQTRHDMLWIREPFLSYEGRLPAVAVHGHTPEDTPAVHPHRIGVDTGAVLGGPLTCA